MQYQVERINGISIVIINYRIQQQSDIKIPQYKKLPGFIYKMRYQEERINDISIVIINYRIQQQSDIKFFLEIAAVCTISIYTTTVG